MVTLLPALSLLLFLACGALQSSAQTAVTRHQAIVPYDSSGKPSPKWENGYLLAYEYDVQPPVVNVFSKVGTRLFTSPVAVPDATRVWLRAPAASPNGSVVVAGTAMKSNGDTVEFLAWLSPAGQLDRIVQTSPYAAKQLCFAPDGTLWAAGSVFTADGKARPPHDILRHYDGRGVLVRSALPINALRTSGREHPAQDAFLACATDRIGFFSASTSEWMDFDSEGKLVGRWPTPTAEGLEITGAGLTSTGNVYLSARRAIPSRPGHSTPEYYKLHRPDSTWVPLSADGIRSRIYGIDGEHIIILSDRGSSHG